MQARERAHKADLVMQAWREQQEMEQQICCRCREMTRRKIHADDSLYREDGTGPYCEDCFDQEPVIEAIQNAVNEQQNGQRTTDKN